MLNEYLQLCHFQKLRIVDTVSVFTHHSSSLCDRGCSVEIFRRDIACFVTCYCIILGVCLCEWECAWNYVCLFICKIVFCILGMLSVMKLPTQGELLQRTCLRCVLPSPLRSNRKVISITLHIHTHTSAVSYYLPLKIY